MTVALPDDHPAWRVIGAWVAARQRGDARAVLDAWVDPASRAEVEADIVRMLALDPRPLRTGAELTIEATVAAASEAELLDVQLMLRGRVEAGPVVSRLGLARLVKDLDGVWKIGALFDAADRQAMSHPAFARLVAERPR